MGRLASGSDEGSRRLAGGRLVGRLRGSECLLGPVEERGAAPLTPNRRGNAEKALGPEPGTSPGGGSAAPLQTRAWCERGSASIRRTIRGGGNPAACSARRPPPRAASFAANQERRAASRGPEFPRQRTLAARPPLLRTPAPFRPLPPSRPLGRTAAAATPGHAGRYGRGGGLRRPPPHLQSALEAGVQRWRGNGAPLCSLPKEKRLLAADLRGGGASETHSCKVFSLLSHLFKRESRRLFQLQTVGSRSLTSIKKLLLGWFDPIAVCRSFQTRGRGRGCSGDSCPFQLLQRQRSRAWRGVLFWGGGQEWEVPLPLQPSILSRDVMHLGGGR